MLCATEELAGGIKRLYGDTFHAMLPAATGKLIVRTRKYLECWTPDELNLGNRSHTVKIRQRHLMNMERESTIVLHSLERGCIMLPFLMNGSRST